MNDLTDEMDVYLVIQSSFLLNAIRNYTVHIYTCKWEQNVHDAWNKANKWTDCS